MLSYIFGAPPLAGGQSGRAGSLRRWLRATVAACALTGLCSLSARAETFESALQTALSSSPDYQTQLEVLRGLNEGVAAARSGLRPTVTGAGSGALDYTDSTESPRTSERKIASASISARQPLFDGFQTRNAIDGAFENVRAGRQNLRQTEQSVLLNAISAYIQVVQAQENVGLARNDVALNRRSLQAARDRFSVGEVTRTDVAQAEAALAESQANLAAQQGALRQAGESYLRFVGVRPTDLAPLPPLPALPETLEEAREIARNNHPSIRAAKANVASAGFGVDEARGALLPQVDLTGSASATSTQANDFSTSNSDVLNATTAIEVTVPLYSGGSLRSAIRRNQALEDQRFQELRATSREILESVGVAWENLETSKATIRSNRAAVRANQIALDGVREEAKVGSRTTLDVLEAQQRLLNSQTALVTSRTDQQINAYSLLSAIGVLSIETLNLDVPRPDLDAEYNSVQNLGLGIPSSKERDDDWLSSYEH